MLGAFAVGGFAAVAGCSSNDSGSTTSVTEMTVNPRRQSIITTQSDDLTISPQPATASATQVLPSGQATSGQTNKSDQSTSLSPTATTLPETAFNQSN